MLATDARITVEALRRLQVISNDIDAGRDVDAVLGEVARAVVDLAGFGVVCAHVVHGDEVRVVAVAGPDDARALLLGRSAPLELWEQLLGTGEAWGELRYHKDPRRLLGSMAYWVPPQTAPASADGQWDPYDALLVPMRSATGELVGVLSVDQPTSGLLPDRTQRELLEVFASHAARLLDNRRLAAENARLRASEETLRRAFDHAPVGSCLVGLDDAGAGVILRANEALCRMFGYAEDEILGVGVAELIRVETEEDSDVVLEAALAGAVETYRGESRCTRADGSTFWGQLHLVVLPPTGESQRVLLAQVEDVTARRESEAELAHRAAHDPLTGLVNRTVIAERLALLLDGARDPDRPGAVLFCDLDHFKQVNDAYGHLVGDEVLASVARRLAGIVRRSDTVGRYGGDEFLVIVPEISAEEARELAMRVVHAIDEPIVVGGTTYRVGASVGIVLLTNAKSASEVLGRADEAMYRAKTRFGRDRYVIHESS